MLWLDISNSQFGETNRSALDANGRSSMTAWSRSCPSVLARSRGHCLLPSAHSKCLLTACKVRSSVRPGFCSMPVTGLRSMLQSQQALLGCSQSQPPCLCCQEAPFISTSFVKWLHSTAESSTILSVTQESHMDSHRPPQSWKCCRSVLGEDGAHVSLPPA